MKTTQDIAADFDRIARAEAANTAESWNHNNHYHGFLLRHAPDHCDQALEVGCGSGAFARLLAQRSDRVVAFDLSPEMLRLARARSEAYPQIEYIRQDVMTADLPAGYFNVIASIATLHHLSLTDVLPKLKAAIKPGGVLLVLDLYQAESPLDHLAAAAGALQHLALNRVNGGGQPESPEARAAWDAHGQSDVYPTLADVRRACALILPGAKVTRHLLWRYSLVWRRS